MSMRPFLFIFAMILPAVPMLAQQEDSLCTGMSDTLRTVVVTGHSSHPAVMDAINRSLNKNTTPRVKTLGDILNERAPKLMDCIMHPFAIKERKRERRQRRLQRVLLEYEQTRTPNELLIEAIKNEQMLDSLRHDATK